MLDLPHHQCNSVYVPWQSKGKRRTMTFQNKIGTSPNHTHRSYTDIRLVRGQAVDFVNATFQAPSSLAYTTEGQRPSEQSEPLRVDIHLDEAGRARQGEWSSSSGEKSLRTPRALQLEEPVLFQSPIRCASPEPFFVCDGWCQYSEVPHPNVVSIGHLIESNE